MRPGLRDKRCHMRKIMPVSHWENARSYRPKRRHEHPWNVKIKVGSQVSKRADFRLKQSLLIELCKFLSSVLTFHSVWKTGFPFQSEFRTADSSEKLLGFALDSSMFASRHCSRLCGG